MIRQDYAGFRVNVDDDGIALLTFSRPKELNGLNGAAKRDLIEAVTQFQYDDRVRVVVFTGEGRAFCAGDSFGDGFWRTGWDESASQPIGPGKPSPINSYSSLRTISQRVNQSIRELDKLTIAAINGVAIQSGLSIALSCDFRIASEEARLGSGTLRFGFLPDEGGHHLLVETIGIAKTMELLMLSRIVSAQEALGLGLVTSVVAPETLMDETMQLARRLSQGPQVAQRLLKRAVYNAAHLTYRQAGEDIAARTAVSDHHPDTKEGVAAWKEKRAPKFE